jgi:phospholipid-binding lipoprotein MlaA
MPTRIRPAILRIAPTSLLVLALAGCATVPPSQRNPHDPWQRMNRATFSFDLGFYKRIVKPVATTYVRVTPHPVRTGVANFVHNLYYPDVIVNALLQGKLRPFARDLGRFVVNTSIGIGGLFDPATRMGLTREDRDLGQTFGKWGIPKGPYVVLPFIGPSDVRDAIGLVPSYTVGSPTYYGHYAGDTAVRYGLGGLNALNTGVELLPIIQLDEEAYDPYAFARDAYLQQRDFMVKGSQGGGAEEELQELQRQSEQPPP